MIAFYYSTWVPLAHALLLQLLCCNKTLYKDTKLLRIAIKVSRTLYFFSLLSHSAVVARELGLPTIVGVSGGLMRKLKVIIIIGCLVFVTKINANTARLPHPHGESGTLFW